MLDNVQKSRLMELVVEGSALPAEERAAFVQRACGNNSELRRELAELLKVDVSGLQGFLAELVVTPVGVVPPVSGPEVLPEIEGYDEFEHLAEGGMGTVFKAQQLRPVRRTVAIKTIRRGMDSKDVLARFQAERQALAIMAHPYIAAVYDAGTDAAGLPYIAMEFVDGLPITEFCEAEQLSLNARLELFVKVCQAVDHAHHRGVLHRDLKPSNVLVERHGDEVMPKVIDFGIAKALEGSLSDRTLLTEQGAFLGTPEYMSPEQILDSAYSVDTRSDVYSLGAVLYELVTRTRPFESTRLREAGLAKLTKIVREEVPQKPSTRLRQLLTTTTERPPQLADHTRWARRLRGDLDWVVMKALEKDPERRYDSPRELAADIDNFLAHRPVIAAAPSGLYRLRAFTRRYRAQVVTAALVFVSLLVGLFGTLWFLVESKANEAAAIARAGEALAAEREAEGIRLATQAAMLARESPNQALLLALEASEMTDDAAVVQTIHGILPLHAERQILHGHARGTRQVRFLEDGRLLSRGFDTTPLLWDVDRGTTLRRFAGHTDRVNRFAVDASRGRLLTASEDGTARVWDIETGECLHRIEDHEGPLTFAAYSADGTRFATAARDGTARVFDARTYEALWTLEHRDAVCCVEFGLHGRRIATRSVDRLTRLFDAETGALLRELDPGRALQGKPPPHVHESLRVWFSPCNSWIASQDLGPDTPRSVFVHTADGELVRELSNVWSPRFLDGGRLLFSTLHERSECWGLLHLESGELEVHSRTTILSVAPTPDGRLAIAVDGRKELCLLDLSTDAILRHYPGSSDKHYERDVAFHPDGKRFAFAGSAVRVLELEPALAAVDLPGDVPHYQVSLAAGERTLAVLKPKGLKTRSWEVWDVGEQRKLCSIDRPDVQQIELSPCATRLIGTLAPRGPRGWRVEVFGLDGRVQRAIQLPPNPDPAGPGGLVHQITDDGRLLLTRVAPRRPDSILVPHANAVLQCHDLKTGRLLASVPDPGGYPAFASGSGREHLVLAGIEEPLTTVVDWRTGEEVARVESPRGWHIGAALSPDGRYLLGVLGEPVALVWDLLAIRSGADPTPIAEYTGLVRSNNYRGGFLRDGQLAWANCTNEVHVFETKTGKTFTVLRLDSVCSAVAPSADGTELITLTIKGRCQRWPLDPLAVARQRAVGVLEEHALEQYEIGTPETRRARKRAFLADNPTPRHCAVLGRMALEEDDLDAAIDWYQRGADLGPLSPWYRSLYLILCEVRSRRLSLPGRSAEQQAVDRDGAFEALRHALRCGVTREQVLAIPSIEALRSLPRFEELLSK